MPDHPPQAPDEGPATSGTGLTQLGTRIPHELKERLRRHVYEQRTSVQHEVIAALDAYLPR